MKKEKREHSRSTDSKQDGSPKEVAVSVDETIDILNWIVENDPELAQKVVTTRFQCNHEVYEHPTIQVGTYTTGDGPISSDVSLLGILNGIFGTIKSGRLDGYGFISVTFDENGMVQKFSRTEKAIDGVG